ncbi:DMT family transporter [Peptostreptococcus faecalis]|uniref:DMT family transporter n=1 Tax=Peptostreptococcus faecalis TaxID=2045015 RepID=UPI000C7E132D|nr:DMT family transporter [Peptostreptococcus faecalis]
MTEAKRKERQSIILITITAVVWGLAVVFQKTGMEHVGPFTFNFFRCIISTAFLSLVTFVISIKKKRDGIEEVSRSKKSLLLGGVLAGISLFLAMATQQVGILGTTASKAGFITTMYIVIVPLLGIFYGKRVSLKIWLCIGIAAVGLYLLSIKKGFVIEKGDLYVLVSAFFFALQIVVVDIFAPKADAIKLSLIQFIVSGILSFILMVGFETVTIAGLVGGASAIIYTGLLSSGVGFTLQIIAQKNLQPTITSLIMSSESIVSMVAGVVILGEVMTSKEVIGCVIMVFAIVLTQVQLPTKKFNEKLLRQTK